MAAAPRCGQTGAFVPCGTGYRFRLVTEPEGREALGTVVFVHAFAEEMNKSRRMAGRLARRLAGNGWRVVQRDLCGCGDSSGDFADATWSAWLGDVEAELMALDPSRPAWLWCERAGALLASPALATRPWLNLLLWQPVTSGAQHLQQFLRLEAGARIVGASKGSAGPTPIQRLRDGACVEIAGYTIAPALAAGLEKAMFDVPADHAGRVVWFEVSPEESPTLSPAASRVVERLRAARVDVTVDSLVGPPFWQTQEIEDCDALIERSAAEVGPGASPR